MAIDGGWLATLSTPVGSVPALDSIVATYQTSFVQPDCFFPFFFVVAEKKNGKSGLATRDYISNYLIDLF